MRNSNPFYRKIVKYSHRLIDWEAVGGYRDRDIIAEDSGVAAVRYELDAPDALAGTRMVFFSDTHYLTRDSIPDNDIIAGLIKDLSPDIMIFGGDMVSYNCAMPGFIDLLKKLPEGPARLAMIGNWDRYKRFWYPLERQRKLLEDHGFELLVNQEKTVRGIRFYGIDDIKAGDPEFRLQEQSDYTVLLAHNPDTVIQVGNKQNLKLIDLCLCGHTHGGQVRLPLIGPVIASSRYRVRFAYGHFRHHKAETNMLVSSGLGCSIYPVRWRCQPEVVLIEFK